MHGIETKLDSDKVWREGQVANRMNVARKTGDKGPDKIVAHSGFSFKDSSGKMDFYVICIIGENLTFIGAFPGVEIFLNKRTDVFRRYLSRCCCHLSCSFHKTQWLHR